MKKGLFVLTAVAGLALVGCRQEGGTADDYGTDTGASAYTNYQSSPTDQSQQGTADQGGTAGAGLEGVDSSATNNMQDATTDQQQQQQPQQQPESP